MNKYIEIIRDELTNIIGSQPYPDDLSEDAVVDICDVVWEAVASINVNFVHKHEYEEFIDILSKYAPGKNPTTLRMLEKIRDYHMSLTEVKTWEGMGSTPEEAISNLKGNIEPRIDIIEAYQRHGFKNKEDYEAAKLANWGHEPDKWIGL